MNDTAIEGLTTKQLKEYMAALKLTKSGTKQALVGRLRKFRDGLLPPKPEKKKTKPAYCYVCHNHSQKVLEDGQTITLQVTICPNTRRQAVKTAVASAHPSCSQRCRCKFRYSDM